MASRLTFLRHSCRSRNGAYSYRLLVPHEAMAYGLTVFDQFRSAHSAIGEVQQFANQKLTFAGLHHWRLPTARSRCLKLPGLDLPAGSGVDQRARRYHRRRHPGLVESEIRVVDPNADPDGDGWSNLQEF